MFLKNKYKLKVFFYFLAVFLLFAIPVAVYQYYREKEYQQEKLEFLLDKYTQIVQKNLPASGILSDSDNEKIHQVSRSFPDSTLRVTVISLSGVVLFDSFANTVENHLHRPEITLAAKNHFGSAIRHSGTTGEDYFYYAVLTKHYYIRTALPFTQQVADFLQISHLFIYFMLVIFMLSIFLLLYATEKVGSSVSRLRDFAKKVTAGDSFKEIPRFDENEVGEIGRQISGMYFKLQGVIAELSLEKEKLLMHIQSSKNGIGIFSVDLKPLVYNKYFIEFVNFLAEEDQISDLAATLELNCFAEIKMLLLAGNHKNLSRQIEKAGRILNIELIIFQDRSFEINIDDITTAVNEKRFKQEMTSNISHELKTPVTAVQGFLETIINNSNLDKDKIIYFIEKSYSQIKRLSELIGDISIVNKLDEAKDLFKIETLNINSLAKEIIYDFEIRMKENHTDCKIKLDNVKEIRGNIFLMDAIFRNLIDNALKYGGKFIDIYITCSDFDENYYYFSVRDTGCGVPEEDLGRIFERFYRVDKGRSRSQGGTGLGLAIVKNAVEFHHGKIFVKSQLGKGVEFTFSISRKLF